MDNNKPTFLPRLLLTAAVSGTLSLPASANDNRNVLEEVYVNAQRVVQREQDVAISMTVLNQEQIANAGMTNTADLASMVPSLSATTLFGPENASFAIRGFTRELRTTASVGVFFAEVAAPRGQYVQTSGDGSGPGTLFDLQNVQVLKGPQGTLFGRNTTGGSVLFVPARPSEEFEGYVELAGGNFGMKQQQVMLNAPVLNNLTLRLSADKKARDGYLNNITGIGAKDLGNADYTAARISLLWDASDAIENYLVVNYADSSTNGHSSQLFHCTDDSPTEKPLSAFTGPGCRNQLEFQRETGQDGFYDVVSTAPNPRTDIQDLRIINKLSLEISDKLTISNILAHSILETENESDVFGTRFTETQATLLNLGVPLVAADPRREFVPGLSLTSDDVKTTDQDTTVAELQFVGEGFDSRLMWQAGMYYEVSKPNGFSGGDSAILISCDPQSIATGDPAQFNCFDVTGGNIGAVSRIRVKTTYHTRALYSQTSYDIFDWLRVTGGVRYNWDQTDGVINFTRYGFAGSQRLDSQTVSETGQTKNEAPTGLLEIQYYPTPDVMTYAKYSRGYRQGSVNMAADAGIQSYDEEKVDAYEIGAKTSFEWLISGRFNFAVFYNDFTDMQLSGGYISQTKGPTTAVFNAGSAEIKGAEMDAFFALTKNLSLSLSYSRLMTELLEIDDPSARVEESAGPISAATFGIVEPGNELTNTPDVAYTATLNYRLPLSEEIGEVSVSGTYIYTGNQRVSSDDNAPFQFLEPFSTINLNASWNNMFGIPLDLTVFGTNVQDKEIVVAYTNTNNALGFESRQAGLPGMWGARLRYSF